MRTEDRMADLQIWETEAWCLKAQVLPKALVERALRGNGGPELK